MNMREILEKTYETLKKQKELTTERIELLKQDERVKEYFIATELSEKLDMQISEMYRSMKREEYTTCSHILLPTLCTNGYIFYGCIKCGLDESVYSIPFDNDEVHRTEERQIMFDFLQLSKIKGKQLGVNYNFDFARAVYKRIKEIYPNIDDATAIKYTEIALQNMSKDVSVDIAKNRARRLGIDYNRI